MEEQNTNTQPQSNLLPPVPGAVIALVFGIISLVLCWYFFIPFAGLVLNIVCLVFAIMAMGKGKKAMAAFEAAPGQYKQGSFSLAKIGKILGLVGLILNIIFLILAILWSFVFGSMMSSGMMNNM
jgi:magnesium-transporting ATPase (P-type)